MTPRRVPMGVFFALFTISGFAGLIYQSIWSHYLKLFLGHAAYAQTLVLAIFMGGMAIGSWLVSRFTARIRNLLRGYAFAEIGIGLLALAFHGVFLGATAWAFDTAIPALGGHGVDLFKWSLASALILPASILLGATFPLMSAGILRAYPESSGRPLAMLYFTNSFGAAIGVLASGFVLIDRFGLPGTVAIAGAMNLVLGLVVMRLARDMPEAIVVESVATNETMPQSNALPRLGAVILALAFATGAASFIYEVTWIRMLSLGLGASTHAFETMLAAFILAMSLGAYWFRDRINRLRNDLAWLAGLLMAKAAFAVYAVWVYSDTLDFVRWAMLSVSRTDGGYVLVTAAGLLTSMVVMFPAAFCAGMSLPLATRILTSRGRGEASIGRVYGANTAGCILGAVVATHFGMEALGVKGLTGLGALLDAAAGAALLVATAPRVARLRYATIAATLIVAGVAAFHFGRLDELKMASGVYRRAMFLEPGTDKLVFYRDGKTATISVVESNLAVKVLAIATNGKPDAAISLTRDAEVSLDESTMKLAGALGLAMKPGAREIANIGFGSGVTTNTLLGSPAVTSLDTIEIESMVLEGAKLFRPYNARAYDDPRSHFHVEDAKTYFAAAGKRYDMIVSEPSNPWVSGVSTLFSEEWYGQVKRYLKDDGLLVQWVQAYEIDTPLMSTIFNALGKHFGDYALYTADGTDFLIVATPGTRLPEMQGDMFRYPGVRDDMAYLGYHGVDDLRLLRIAGRKVLDPLFARMRYPANSDYHPILDQRAAGSRFRGNKASELAFLREELVPILPILDAEARIPGERFLEPDRIRSRQAGAGRDAIVGIHAVLTPSVAESQAGTQGRAAVLIRKLAADCSGLEELWTDQLTALARPAMLYAVPEDVQPLLDFARKSACGRSLRAENGRRLALMEATNRRDLPAMTRIAEEGLRGLAPGDERLRDYYLMTAMTSLLALNEPARAKELGRVHVPLLTPTVREGLAMQFLVAQLADAERRLARASGPSASDGKR